jgi:peptidoglycan/xylan/chitin deacetylase (PgdA/CDA1 family)
MLPEERFARIWRCCTAREQLQLLLKDLQRWGGGGSGSLDMYSWSRRLKRLPLDAKHMMLSHLEDTYRVPQDRRRRFMTWEEALIMSRNGMTFGSHTVHHATLATEQPATILQELIQSRRMIDAKLGGSTTLLAYPNGSYDERVLELAAEAGYLHAFTTDYGYHSRKTRSLAIPRLSMADSLITDQTMALHAPRTRLYLQRFPGQSVRVQPA